ncbi:MAG: F0F1 ATP synthase subunit alpha, partial [Ignavibacteria bacterium]
DLAQYRELEAFAKFGSDLDQATQRQLRRGQRLVELLKQDQYKPMPVEKQVVSIFYGTSGYLDQISISDVRKFEQEILEYIELKHKDILTEILETKDLSEKTIEKLKQIGDEFLKTFKKSS